MAKPVDTTSLKKQLQRQRNQFCSQKALLQQKISILSSQLQEYRQRESQHRMLNQSIMATYKKNESMVQKKASDMIKQLKARHQKEFSKMKRYYQQENQKLSFKLKQLKGKQQNVAIQLQKQKLQQEKKIFELKKLYQDKIAAKMRQKQRQLESTVQQLQQKLKQAEKMADLYQQFLERNKQRQMLQMPDSAQNIIYTQTNSGITEKIRGSMRNSRSQQFLSKNAIGCYKLKQSYSKAIPGLTQTKKIQIKSDKQNNDQLIKQQSWAKLRKYQESNKRSRRISSSNKESMKALSIKLERAINDLKPSKHQKLIKNQRLSQRLNQQFKKLF